MKLTNRVQDNVCIVEIDGRLSAENVEALRTLFMQLFKDCRRFVFDLAKMDNLDSTGLGTLVFCMKTCTEIDGKLELANLNDKPRMIFEVTKAYRIFDIYDSLDAALTAAAE